MSIFKQIKSILGKAEVATPPASAPAVPSGPVERRSRKRLDSHKGRRVLIVDDSPTIVAALRKMLRSAGCITLEAPTAEKGLEVVNEEKPDLVFLDIVLPGMNGFAALRLMRRDPLTHHIPVIMISGNEQATEQFYAKRIGADDFMKKPFSRHEVFARVDALVELNKLARLKASAQEVRPIAPIVAPPAVTPAVSPVLPHVTPSTAPIVVEQPVKPPAPAANPAAVVASMTAMLEARTQLTAMGLQYFSQDQFIAAIDRGDQLAVKLFIAGGGVNLPSPANGESR